MQYRGLLSTLVSRWGLPATSAATAAITAAAVASATTASATTATIFAWSGFVDADFTTVELGAVDGCHGRVALAVI
jgi:spermidine/putrescine-binding protein